MTETPQTEHSDTQPPELGEGTDIDAAELDVEAPVEEPTATSDAEAYTENGETLGGTGGLDAGGAG
jgi:hypothetical protein